MKLWSTKALLLPRLQSATEQIGLSQPRLPRRACVWTDKDVRGVPALISPGCASLFLLLHSVRRYRGAVDSSFISDSSHKLDPSVRRACTSQVRPRGQSEMWEHKRSVLELPAPPNMQILAFSLILTPRTKKKSVNYFPWIGAVIVIHLNICLYLLGFLQEFLKSRSSAANP